jgi:hypothetical protein
VKLRVAWDFAALAAFYALEPFEAMRVDRAVIRYAETGEGQVERVPPYYRLHAGSFGSGSTKPTA